MASTSKMASTGNEAGPSRFVVGIDLGTTNSALAYVDTQADPWRLAVLDIPQVVAAGQVEARQTLPSFHYEPAGKELPPEALKLPWEKKPPRHAVGVFARDHGALVPARLIASAKSWLCHTGVDRTAPLLPWHGAEDAERLSPVEASGRYLAHMRAAWDAQFPEYPLAEQDVVITLPASFDEVARELTVKAAQLAGLPRIVLIEEPQAAFYAWIDKHRDNWQEFISPGQKILVCDVGGGTSDFTLIRARRAGQGSEEAEDRKVQFQRVAVGQHLILGGDNLDLALAHHLEEQLGRKLEARSWSILVRTCRRVKEELLTPGGPAEVTINLPASGSKLIGGSQQLKVRREDAIRLLLEGFFPLVKLTDAPQARASGFQEFGLPYAADAAVTRYLAAFLSVHRHAGQQEEALHGVAGSAQDPARPDVVLFNGGVFASPLLRQRVIECLEHWFRTPDEPQWTPQVLEEARLDLAVAQGAAYYGMVRRGAGVRIAAGLARTYYIGVESEPPQAMCLLPAGTDPGTDITLDELPLLLTVSQPVEFPLYVSSTRLTDPPGELVPFDREQMTQLPPIRTVLQTRRKGETEEVAVRLHARLTEIGTLDLWCSEVAGKRSWRLQFDVRSTTQTDVAAHEGQAETAGFVDEEVWQACAAELAATFGPDATASPDELATRLHAATGDDRHSWPPSLLRRMWDLLRELEPGRRKSAKYEARWLNLLGFALRPGYGLALDDWRVAETWRLVQGKLAHATPRIRSENWILWRRVAGGLAAGQQIALADPLLASVRQLHKQTTTGRGKGGDPTFGEQQTIEAWRLLGSLELIPLSAKTELIKIGLELAGRSRFATLHPALIWMIGRVAARSPMYGPLNTVVPADQVNKWFAQLLEVCPSDGVGSLCVMQVARRTDDRYRDLGEGLRRDALSWLKQADAPAHYLELVETGGTLGGEEQGLVFGESLPRGLRLG